jgi:glycosyltransferase involved in cell wall biosynthesis
VHQSQADAAVGGRDVAGRPSNGRDILRLAFVTDSVDPSGIGTHMLALASALREQAELLLVFACDKPALRWWHRANAAGLPAKTLATSELQSGGQRLVELLRTFRPDIAHVHAGISWEGHGIARAARAAGIPAVVRTEHLPYTLRPLKDCALEAWYARESLLADRIICVSSTARATFRMSAADTSRYRIVPNGIPPCAPLPRSHNTVRERLQLHEVPLILTVGRFTEQKQHTVLLQAMPRVQRQCPSAHLLLVGCGPLETRLRNQGRSLGIGDRVRFLGAREDVPELLAAADAFCLPSHFEGHPLALMEAMAAGLPVVATRAAGITDVIKNGETGILVPVGDPVALSAALIRVLSNEALGRALGQRGQSEISRHFTAEHMAKRTMAVYRELLSDS